MEELFLTRLTISSHRSLIDRWFIEIDEIIDFNPESFDTSRAQFGFYFIELFEDFFESLGLTQAESDLYISVLIRY